LKLPRRTLLRWHLWLGWAVAVPLLFWTASGLFMTLRPIEEVRGTPLRAELPPLPALAPVPPSLGPDNVESLSLEQTALGPRWIVATADGRHRAADPRSGLLLPPLSRVEAASAGRAYRANGGAVNAVTLTDAAHAPLDLRQERPAWAVAFADGARFYIDADTGELLAVRTRFWRAYDWMWGLHIMDLQGREDTHHPLLIGFAALALANLVLGAVLLFRRTR
jgi:hypothetical protein